MAIESPTRVKGVKLVNNAADQALRPALLWRKCCVSEDSTPGKEFVARILAIAATYRRLRRDILTYVTDAVAAYRIGHYAEPLLATPYAITREVLACSQTTEG